MTNEPYADLFDEAVQASLDTVMKQAGDWAMVHRAIDQLKTRAEDAFGRDYSAPSNDV